MDALIVKKPRKYPGPSTSQENLRELQASTVSSEEAAPMVRTQIYLTRAEHGFIAAEAARLGEPMAAVIRGYIDDKMRLPDSAWASNPMLEPTPADPDLQLPEDAAINHDHYLYGAPKKYVRKRGQWMVAEPEARR
jgi:hypothetical protein